MDLIKRLFKLKPKPTKPLNQDCPKVLDKNNDQFTFRERGGGRVFTTNLNFLISISLHPDGINLRYFKLRIFDLIHGSKYPRYTTFGCKDYR